MKKELNLPSYKEVKMFSNYVLYETKKERCCLRLSNTSRFVKGITIYKLHFDKEEIVRVDYIFQRELTRPNWVKACKIAQKLIDNN